MPEYRTSKLKFVIAVWFQIEYMNVQHISNTKITKSSHGLYVHQSRPKISLHIIIITIYKLREYRSSNMIRFVMDAGLWPPCKDS